MEETCEGRTDRRKRMKEGKRRERSDKRSSTHEGDKEGWKENLK